MLDIETIISDETIKALTICKNNGGIEMLTKTDAYDSIKARIVFTRSIKKYAKRGINAEYDNAVRLFLAKMQDGGMFEWIK